MGSFSESEKPFRIILVLWLVLIGLLSVVRISTPGPENSDKAAHFIVYFITVLLYFRAYKTGFPSHYIVGMGVVFLYSLTLESAQFFLPYRSFSLADLGANLTGIIAGTVVDHLGSVLATNGEKR